MAHALVFTSVVGNDARFQCSVCGQIIGFNKEGIGQPYATDNGDGTWSHPDNPDQWMDICTP
jgi:hypothetical protein